MRLALASPSLALLPPRSSLAAFAADYALRTVEPSPPATAIWQRALWSVAERALSLPRIEKPGELGGLGIYVERTLLDAFLPFNVTLSAVLAGVTACAGELTRTGKLNDLVTYLAGEDEHDAPPPSLPWEWDRVGHDMAVNFAKDVGAQTLTRYLEIRSKPWLAGSAYCELLKHAHKAACKEFHDARGAGGRYVVASKLASGLVLRSPLFYAVRALTSWVADVAVDTVAYIRGQLSGGALGSNVALKAAKYGLGGALCFALGSCVPFLCPHPYVFIGVEQLVGNVTADALVSYGFGLVDT